MNNAKNCITHSYACDCREELFRITEQQNLILKTAIEAELERCGGTVPILKRAMKMVNSLEEKKP